MKIYSVDIKNFRGIRSATLNLPDHAVLIGDNNTGKSTVLEAIDLALGPDRLNRRPPVDEHDLFQVAYLTVFPTDAPEGTPLPEPPQIRTEGTIPNLPTKHQRPL